MSSSMFIQLVRLSGAFKLFNDLIHMSHPTPLFSTSTSVASMPLNPGIFGLSEGLSLCTAWAVEVRISCSCISYDRYWELGYLWVGADCESKEKYY